MKVKLVFKKVLRVIATAVFAVIFGVFLINLYILTISSSLISSEENSVSLGTDSFQAILILGAGIWNDRPSPMLAERLDTGIFLYKKGIATKIVLSGDGQSPNYDEVTVMAEYLRGKGISESDIIEDRKGLRTYASIYRAKSEYGYSNIVIVTQKYHIYRAQYIATKLGINSRGVYCDKQIYGGHVYRLARELMARVLAFKDCIFKTPPY